MLLLFLLAGKLVEAQDFDIYPRMKDENVEMSSLYENTQFKEYQLLSRNIRMLDMAYAAIVPGYVHFRAKDYTMGYSLLGTRVAAYAGLAYNYSSMNKINKSILEIPTLGSEYKTDKVIFYSSMSIIVSSYLFDWIHGKMRLEKKQELIRYRYSIKLKMNQLTQVNYPNNLSPNLSISYRF